MGQRWSWTWFPPTRRAITFARRMYIALRSELQRSKQRMRSARARRFIWPKDDGVHVMESSKTLSRVDRVCPLSGSFIASCHSFVPVRSLTPTFKSVFDVMFARPRPLLARSSSHSRYDTHEDGVFARAQKTTVFRCEVTCRLHPGQENTSCSQGRRHCWTRPSPQHHTRHVLQVCFGASSNTAKTSSRQATTLDFRPYPRRLSIHKRLSHIRPRHSVRPPQCHTARRPEFARTMLSRYDLPVVQ